MINTTMAGNLTRDPEIRYTREVSPPRRSDWLSTDVGSRVEVTSGEESTSFFDVVCWRDLAENVALSLVKGSRVVVAGRLEQRTWENEDGDRRSRIELVAEDVGASLRFATAEVTRTERRTPSQEDSPGSSDSVDDPEAVGADA